MFQKKFRKKPIDKKNRIHMLAVFWIPIATLILGVASHQVWADDHPCVIELDESDVFIEYNSTDDDRGIQFFWDGEPWKLMKVKNQAGQAVLKDSTKTNVKAQGLTEGFFESAEPESDELSEEEFFARLPEGEYTFKGRALDGCRLVGEAELTHNLPTPVILDLSGFPFIEWAQPVDGPEITGYEIVVELVAIEGDDERVFVNTATFTDDVNEFTVSPEFVDLIQEVEEAEELEVEELKVEVIAIEESGNKTITEQEVE